MIRNHAKRDRVRRVCRAGQGFRMLNDGEDVVDIENRLFVLENRGHAFEAHPRVDAAVLERRTRPVRLLVELRKHQVPVFHETRVAFRAERARAEGFAAVQVQLRTRTAGAGVARRTPEIVFCAQPDDLGGGDADLRFPNARGLVIIFVHRHPDPFGGNLDHLGGVFPCPLNRFPLEIVAEREIAHHFEERHVTRGLANLIEVVGFAPGPQAFLRRGGPPVRHRNLARVVRFKLHHARAAEQKRRIVAGHDFVAAFNYVAAFTEEFKITGTDVVGFHACSPLITLAPAAAPQREHKISETEVRFQSGRPRRPSNTAFAV